jgi:hypothetical protein
MSENDKIFCMLLVMGLLAILGTLAIPSFLFIGSKAFNYYLTALTVSGIAFFTLLGYACVKNHNEKKRGNLL